MQRIFKFYQLINILSLDVAFGAAISAYFLASVFHVIITIQVSLCLGLTVWLIYTADHLIDAKMIKEKASTMRHQFHQQYFRIVLTCAIVVFAVIVALLFLVQTSIFYWGLCLSVMVIVYFFIQRQFGLLKELLGALLYTFGVMIPVIALSDQSLPSLVTLPILLFFNTALINLILFSWFDFNKDVADNHLSLAISLGKKATGTLLYFLFLIQFVLLVFSFTIEIFNSSIFAMMFLTLLFVYFGADWFATTDKYRMAGDAIFLIPILHLIV